MKAREELQPKKNFSTCDKPIANDMNSHVVRLLQDKLLPLRREKYNHLQKINLALRKDETFFKSNSVCSLHKYVVKKMSENTNKPPTSSRTQKHNLTQELLLGKLKKISNQTQITPRQSKGGKMDQFLEEVEKKMADFKKQSCQEIEKHQQYSKKSRKSKKRILFSDLALKAERHLRIRKHDLKEKFLEEFEGKRAKPLELEKITANINQKPIKHTSDAQLQRELLQDIRETMLEEKINRLKRDINHKKIVQMR